MTKIVVFLLLVLSGVAAHAQSTDNYEKLSKVSELWGLIKYFHPDRPGNAFDSVFAAQVPVMLAVKDEQYRRPFNFKFTSDSVLKISLPSTSVSEDFFNVITIGSVK